MNLEVLRNRTALLFRMAYRSIKEPAIEQDVRLRNLQTEPDSHYDEILGESNLM